MSTGELNPLGSFYLISHLCVRVYEREEMQFLDHLVPPPKSGDQRGLGEGPGCDEGKWDRVRGGRGCL